MNTPNELFLRRLKFEWKNIYRNWKMVIDWTVALYIIIPYGIFVVQQYLNWWSESPNWIDAVPFNLFIGISALFAWSGTVRLFIKEADQLFLLNRNKWIKEIIKRGIAYSVILDFFLSLFFFIILGPFFIVNFEVSLSSFGVLFFVTFLSKVVLSLLKQLIELSFNGFKQRLVLRTILILTNIIFILSIPALIATSLANQLITLLLLLLLNSFLVVKRLNISGGFFKDVEREQKEEFKYVKFLLIMSGASFPKPKKERLRPLLFRQSNLIFKKRTVANGLVELSLKSTLRNKSSLLHYAQIVILGLLIIGVFPDSVSLFLWLGLGFILTSFVSLFWSMTMGSQFFRLFKWKDEDVQYGSQKFLFIMTLPGFMIISFFAGFKAFSWIGALLILPVGVLVILIMSRAVSLHISMSTARQEKNKGTKLT